MKILTTVLLILANPLFIFADWLGFRGTHGNGIIDGQISPEISMDSKNSWTAQLPGRGLSSPILVDDLVVLTASSDPNQSTLHILAFDAKNGDLAWERRFKATGRTVCHNKTCVAASTMVSDGKVVVAQFSSNDIFCLDLDGNIKWLRGLTYDYPNIANGLGMSSSPVLAKGVMIAQVENDAESFTFGLNLQNGMSIWRKNRPRGANWTSPVVLKKGSSTWVGLQSKKGLAFINPLDGEVLWNFEGGASTIPSSAITDENTVIVPSNGLTAFEQPIAAKSPTTIWKNNKLAPGTGSPTVFDKEVFVVNRANVLTSASTENGEINWRLRIKGPVSASPITTGNLLLVFNEEGLGQIVDISDRKEGKLIKEIDLKDTILCTPAADKGSVFVRSDKNLWKLSL